MSRGLGIRIEAGKKRIDFALQSGELVLHRSCGSFAPAATTELSVDVRYLVEVGFNLLT